MYNHNDGSNHINALQNQFTAYLSTALRRSKIRYLQKRDKQLQKEVSLEDFDFELSEPITPLHIIIYAVDGEILRMALKKIKARERHILLARVIDEKSFAEIADELGMEYKTVTSAYYRVIVKLRKQLGGDFDEF